MQEEKRWSFRMEKKGDLRLGPDLRVQLILPQPGEPPLHSEMSHLVPSLCFMANLHSCK